HVGTALVLPMIASCRCQPVDEVVLELTAEAPCELERAGGVAEILHRLDAGELVEEPAAARLHEECLARELERPAGLDRRRGRERPARLVHQKARGSVG